MENVFTVSDMQILYSINKIKKRKEKKLEEKTIFHYFVIENFFRLKWRKLSVSKETMKDLNNQFSYNSSIYLCFILIYWLIKLFISEQIDSVVLPDLHNIVTRLHLGILGLIFIRLLFNYYLWKHSFDILLFLAIYGIEFYETLAIQEKSEAFSYFTLITMCFLSLFLKLKLKDLIFIFILYLILYITNVFIFLNQYDYQQPLIVCIIFFLTIVSKSFSNYCMAYNCELYENIKEKTREIEFNEKVLNRILFNTFPKQWIVTLNDRNFVDTRVSKNCFLIRFKIFGFENLQSFYEKKEFAAQFGDPFFSKIEDLINQKVNFFGFEKYSNSYGEYIILANMVRDSFFFFFFFFFYSLLFLQQLMFALFCSKGR
jgi:hypothetical protein